MHSLQILVLVVLIILTPYSGPAAAGHPHGDPETDAILRFIGEADEALAQSRDVLSKSADLTAPGSAMAPVRESIERTAAQMRNLRTAIHVAFEHPQIHENNQALGSLQKGAREMARMSAALRTMSNETVNVAKRARPK